MVENMWAYLEYMYAYKGMWKVVKRIDDLSMQKYFLKHFAKKGNLVFLSIDKHPIILIRYTKVNSMLNDQPILTEKKRSDHSRRPLHILLS